MAPGSSRRSSALAASPERPAFAGLGSAETISPFNTTTNIPTPMGRNPSGWIQWQTAERPGIFVFIPEL
jgi:hypothetical protein